MSSRLIAVRAVSSFDAYTAEYSPGQLRKHLGHEPQCLADFIQAWVQYGKGVSICLGDFQTFLIASIAIIDDWRDDPGSMDYMTTDEERATGSPKFIERRPQTIFGEAGMDHDILDPHFFALWTFRMFHESEKWNMQP